jgi:hypothetical protein
MRSLPLLTALLLCIGNAAAAPPAPPAELVKRGEARVAAATERIKLVEEMYKRGMVSLGQLASAWRDWAIAQRESPLPPDSIAAATRYRDIMATFLKEVEARQKRGAASEADLAAARYDLAEAEFWLEEATWKAGAR